MGLKIFYCSSLTTGEMGFQSNGELMLLDRCKLVGNVENDAQKESYLDRRAYFKREGERHILAELGERERVKMAKIFSW